MVVIWIITEFMWLIFFCTLPSVIQDDKTDCNTTAPVSISQGSTTVHGAARVGHITSKSSVSPHEQDVTGIKTDGNKRSWPVRGIGTQENIEHGINGGSLDNSGVVQEDERSPMLPSSPYSVNSPPGTFSRLSSSASYGAVTDSISHAVVPEQTISESSPATKASLSCFGMVSELLREEIVVLLGLMFVTMFNQISLEVNSHNFSKFCLLLLRFFFFFTYIACCLSLRQQLYHWRKKCCTGQKCQLAYSTVGLECWYKYITVCDLRSIVIIVMYLFQTVLSVIIVGLLSRKVPDR